MNGSLAKLELKTDNEERAVVVEIKKRNNWQQLLEDMDDFEILAEEFHIEKSGEKRKIRKLLKEEPEYKELQTWWKNEKKETEEEAESE